MSSKQPKAESGKGVNMNANKGKPKGNIPAGGPQGTNSVPEPQPAALSEEDKKCMLEIMKQFEINHEQTSPGELFKALDRLDMNTEIESIMKSFSSIDFKESIGTTRPKEPEFTELFRILAQDSFAKAEEREEFIGELFRLIDSDNDGFISFEDFKVLSSKIGESCNEAELQKYFETLPGDQNKVSKASFTVLFNSLVVK